MANTCDCMIAGFLEDSELHEINKAIAQFGQGGFQNVSDGNRSGGTRSTSLEAFAWCPLSCGERMIEVVKTAFLATHFEFPETCVLIVNDDNTERFFSVQAEHSN